MKLDIIAVGTKMPKWVLDACGVYQKRLPNHWQCQLHEVPACKRLASNPTAEILAEEGRRISRIARACTRLIALERSGHVLSSQDLAKRCQQWQADNERPAIIIGGPEGICPQVLANCHEQWSLSALTMPHPIVRVVLFEQLFRAHSINIGHPYHK